MSAFQRSERMGLHTIEIDDAQVLTLADLAAQLAAARAWGWHEVATDLRSDAWDFISRTL